jgi:hypothetical protein
VQPQSPPPDALCKLGVEPKTSGTVHVYSFLIPSGNKASLSIEVRLVEAQWVQVKVRAHGGRQIGRTGPAVIMNTKGATYTHAAKR